MKTRAHFGALALLTVGSAIYTLCGASEPAVGAQAEAVARTAT